MSLHLLALGDAGARLARSVLYALCAGVMPQAPLTITLLCAPQEAADGVFAAYRDYEAVQRHTANWQTGCFSGQATLLTWPEEQAAFSLNDQARTETDQLLNRALFTREQASLSPTHAMDAGYDVAAMSWAAMLSDDARGAMKQLQDDLERDPQTPVVLLGSLCETVCAAGVPALCTWTARYTDRKPAASLLLPVYGDERAELCARVLASADLEHRLRSLCLTGWPEDCRTAEHGQIQLADWLTAYAACRQLEGMEGAYTWRIQPENLAWNMFGEDEETWRSGYEALMQVAYLMAGVYGEQLLASMASPNRLRDRMTPWHNAHFAAVRRMDDEARRQLQGDVQALVRLLGGAVDWMRQLQENLPPMMRWADALRDARKQAETHYAKVLDIAGQHAWLAGEIARSGMAEEHIVHRHDMKDTEAEAAMKQLNLLSEKLTEVSAAQDELNHALGGRLTRSMLQTILEHSASETADMRSQADEAARRIDQAALIAKPEDMPKIATARTRLERMERHVVLLEGRTKQVRKDAARWAGAALRSQPPVLPEDEAAATGLFGAEWLTLLHTWYDENTRDTKQLANQLAESWPWTEQPMKPLCEQVARNEFPQAGDDCLAGFLRCMLRSLQA